MSQNEYNTVDDYLRTVYILWYQLVVYIYIQRERERERAGGPRNETLSF